jgi:hypothetical protein
MLKQRNRPTTPSKYIDNNNTAAATPVASAGGPMSAKRSPNDRKSPRSSANSISRTAVPPLGPKMATIHWSREVREVTVVTSHDGIFNFRIVGGSDNGEFPVIAEVLPPDTRGVEYRSGAELTTQVTSLLLLLLLLFLVGMLRTGPKFFSYIHRLNMELDLQSLFGLLCRAILIGCNPASPALPRIWAHIRERYWSSKIDDIPL